MPPVSRPALILLAFGLLAAAWATGLLKTRLDERGLELAFGRPAWVITIEIRDSGLLLLLVVSVVWAAATAVDRAGWVSGTGRLVPAVLVIILLGWVLCATHLPRRVFLTVAGPAILLITVLATLDAVRITPTFDLPFPPLQALGRWAAALIFQPLFGLLNGLLAAMLLTGLWTVWWVFRRRSGLVSLLPSATILAVEILNDPSPALYFYCLVWLGSAALLLLRLNYVALKARWRARRLPRAADTSWVFGEIGFEATALLLVAAFLLPPLSSRDISNYLVPGSLNTRKIFHPISFGNSARTGGGDVGYSDTVRPGFQLTAKPVPIMAVFGDFSSLYPYWRGVALGAWDGIQWTLLPASPKVPVRDQPRLDQRERLSRDDLPDDRLLTPVQNTFRVVAGQDQTLNTAFSSGELISIDRQRVSIRGAVTALPPFAGGGPAAPVNVGNAPRAPFDTVDRVKLIENPRPPYDYTVNAVVPTGDEQSLRQAGTRYPDWVRPYIELYAGGHRDPRYSVARDKDIADLAAKIVAEARATNPYDQAKAIEAWFRDKERFTYTLTPPSATDGVRPLDSFLFESRRGYCQDFSTAMAVMLRDLGIPVRQMSGFGLGTYDAAGRRYLVRANDAHTWVDVYFPGYGWVPFEPTPDGANFPVSRPATADDFSALADSPGVGATRGAGDAAQNEKLPFEDEGDFGGGPLRVKWSRTLPVALGVLVALLLLLLGFLRWLLAARDMPRIWRRLLFLGDRLGVPRTPGDTPHEYGARLADAVPPIAPEVQALARLYTRATFRRRGLEPHEVLQVHTTWRSVRRRYPGLLARAWRDAFRRRAAGGSGSRVPLSRR